MRVWIAVTAIASLITALVGAGLGIAAWVQRSREAGAKSTADAAQVGLSYMKDSLSTQHSIILTLKGEIGELRGLLKECHDERKALASQMEEQAHQIESLSQRLGDSESTENNGGLA